jgi:FtsH-binding integral membrane protein
MSRVMIKAIVPKTRYDLAGLISSILFTLFLFTQFALPLLLSDLNGVFIPAAGVFLVGTLYFYAMARRRNKQATHLGLLVLGAAVLDFLLSSVFWMNLGVESGFAFASAITGSFLAFLVVLVFIDQTSRSLAKNEPTNRRRDASYDKQ